MTITSESIEALRRPHRACCGSASPCESPSCQHCHKSWPCDTYAALTLALEAETLRTALEGIVTGIDNHHPKFAAGPFTLTRQEIAAARAALGGDS